MSLRSIKIAAILAAALTSTAAIASPILQLQGTVSNQGNPATKNLSASTSSGIVTYGPTSIGTLKNISLTGQSTPVLNSPDLMDMLGVMTSKSMTNATLFMSFSNLTQMSKLFNSSMSATLTGKGSWVTMSVYFVPSNTPFSTAGGTLIASCNGATGTNSSLAFSCNSSKSISLTGFGPGGYTLTDVITVHLDNGGTFSFDDQLQAVPEPSALALFGTGLIGIGAAVRRRFSV